MAELELLMCHLIRNFKFGASTLEMRQKLPPQAEDLELGSTEEIKFTCDIIDLDGVRIKGVSPGIADVDQCMESVSGSLYPIQESACFVENRDL